MAQRDAGSEPVWSRGSCLLYEALPTFAGDAMGTDEEHARIAAERQAALDAILDSDAAKKLIVAGPGTGKTYTFKAALERAGGGVALTFIRALVRDLRVALADTAEIVNTFHGFAKHLLHSHPHGVDAGFWYCPALPIVFARDLTLLGFGAISTDDVNSAFQTLDHAEGLITESLRLGNYYNAVGHNDVVYRVLRRFTDAPGDIPEYSLVVVDEYQDFNPLETALIRKLEQRSPVLIAGDDDQALYHRKHASPEFIRELAVDNGYAKFELPYCSRCTTVIVDAVNNVIERAVANGNLPGRLEKTFTCYLPDKAVVSDAHPTIIRADCTVDSSQSPYIARYVAEQIAAIPREDAAASRAGGYPTVLVIGTGEFVKPVYEHLRERFSNVQLAGSTGVELTLLEAYRLLARDARSRLGWRIVLELDPPDGRDDLVIGVLEDELEFADELPDGFSDRHLLHADAIARLIGGEDLGADAEAALEAAVGLEIEQIGAELTLDRDVAEEASEEADNGEEGDADPPTIVCSTMVSAKGLSAEHVFIVGFNDEHFPRHRDAITDYEVCCLLVALSRTRKQCHVVSCGRWKGQPVQTSAFLGWLGVPITQSTRNAAYWQENPPL
jgi:ATP-dependent DNA helicase UvrD/PcrA